MKLFKSATTAIALVLSTNASSAIISMNVGWSGNNTALYETDVNIYNGYVIGKGATADGIDTSVMTFDRFDSSLGNLVSVTLNYDYYNQGFLRAGSFESPGFWSETAGVSAKASHIGQLTYGFNSNYNTQIESGLTSTYAASQANNLGYHSVPWNLSKLWYGSYTSSDDIAIISNNARSITFTDGLDNFINSDFSLELLARTYNSIITGCNLDSTCGMDVYTYTAVQASLTYVYDDLASSPVPVPAAAWLFGSGLIGLLGVARRRKAA